MPWVSVLYNASRAYVNLLKYKIRMIACGVRLYICDVKGILRLISSVSDHLKCKKLLSLHPVKLVTSNRDSVMSAQV